jgi:HAD superfamily hydrolase (TIGR01509 family)
MYGKRNDDIVRAFYGDALPESQVLARGAAKEQLYREMIAGNVERMLSPGLRQFLARHCNAPMAVASNAEPANVSFILKQAGLASCFRAIVDGHQVERPKPFPDVYLRAAELLGAPPEDCIVFEDSYSGIEAARAAGMRVVGLSTTHPDLPADLVIEDFLSKELESWLGVQRQSR